jgi:AmmeMemoRadiSam system protein B
MAIRETAVAGFFYPGDEGSLLSEVDACLAAFPCAAPGKAIAVVMPHAGYVYSGRTAGAVAAAIDVPDRVLVLGPKHTRLGARAAVAAATAWRFPFGDVPIDRPLADALCANRSFEADDAAHREEHSLEVQVPFLWRRNPGLRLTPVALGHTGLDQLREIGAALAAAIAAAGEPILIVASTDLSHQVPIEEAKRLDGLALARVLALDPEGLFRTVADHGISMCGVIPVTAALFAARLLGASRAELIRYTTSAEASGDTRRVVGYAGLVVA